MTPDLHNLIRLLVRVAVDRYWAELQQEKESQTIIADKCATEFAEPSADALIQGMDEITKQGVNNDK